MPLVDDPEEFAKEMQANERFRRLLGRSEHAGVKAVILFGILVALGIFFWKLLSG